MTPPFKCIFCGYQSWCDPADQSPPPDYCHESDHGTPDLFYPVEQMTLFNDNKEQ